MANPTTNFGWVMPTSSSLVTNLPADFNTFGQAVDTSMSELLGGTTGQVLSKTSNTNMDFTWVTPTDQTPLTTKGDLFTFTTVDARLGVGTDGQTLVADSSTATGLKWATPASGMTNPMTTTGDTIYSSSGSTPARLPIGTTGQVLTVAAGVPSWATPASGGMTLISTTSLTGTTTTLSSIPQTYINLLLVIEGAQADTGGFFRIAPNANTTTSDNITLEYSGGGSPGNQGTQNTYIRSYTAINNGNANNQLVFNFFRYASSMGAKTGSYNAAYYDGGGTSHTEIGGFLYEVGAITSLVLSMSGAPFTAGTAYLYGVK